MHKRTSQAAVSDTLEYLTLHAVILRQPQNEVLLAAGDGHLELPLIIIPRWRRVTQEITEFARRIWGLQALCLLQTSLTDGGEGEDNFAIMESRDPLWAPPPGFSWVAQDCLARTLSETKTARFARELLERMAAQDDGPARGPFARQGWFDNLLSWIQTQLDDHRLRLTGRFSQLNCDACFCLLRLETSGKPVWFKAVGHPNRHEFPVTLALARHFPAYLPTIIASAPCWNGWLTYEAEGAMLDEASPLSAWERAAESLAELQMQSVPVSLELLHASCRDLRMGVLLKDLDDFLESMAGLMARQPKTPPAVLSAQELRAMGARVRELCSRLDEVDLPCTLGHLDFNPGNIIAGPDRCVFLDWAEAYVGHPFLTFEYLREHLSRMHPGNAGWRSQVTSRYLDCWTGVASRDRLDLALSIAPLTAVFAYAVAGGAWRDPQRLGQPNAEGYFRSLTRRIYREAQQVGTEAANA